MSTQANPSDRPPLATALLLCLGIVGIVAAQSSAAGEPHVSHSYGDGASLRYGSSGYQTFLPVVTRDFLLLSITMGQSNHESGLYLDYGGDVDTEVVTVGSPAMEARRSGNGRALPSADGNQVGDWYVQFRANDGVIYAGAPTTRLRVEIEYFDQGTDAFSLEYDALSGGPYGDGRFKGAGRVHKSNTQRFQTVALVLGDAHFANRDNGADFRISDDGDGAEIIRRLTITLLPPGPSVMMNVDSFGANPWDSYPDSDAIQACIDSAFSGDTVTFTSGENSPGYEGYVIDKTIFLVTSSAKSDVTFTSTDPANHALLRADASLKGFVVRLYTRSRVSAPGDIDDITVSHLSFNGGRDVRRCFGADGQEDGVDDSFGSWLPECSEAGDPWCRAGTLAMEGLFAGDDPSQNYTANPSHWSTGLLMDDLHISNTECGTALAMSGAANTILNSTIDTAGDHVHVSGCAPCDNDEGLGDWSDGITFIGPGHVIEDNTVVDASDVGIVFFGGKDTHLGQHGRGK